jgi:16S rRNA (guanine(527)-N(7))-methyltransferase RsmG
MASLAATLKSRANRASLEIPPHLIDPFLAYFDVLSRWNRKINLTALSDTDQAIDRLLLEPLAAGRLLPRPDRLVDLGSGGGSPAIPLALTIGAGELVMIESRARKAAFLREVVRIVQIRATVESARFEDVAQEPRYRGSADLVSMRAVRLDEASRHATASLLKSTGVFALFTSSLVKTPTGFVDVAAQSLIRESKLQTFRLERSTWNSGDRVC